MNLYTRCPACETTFKVTTQQLQASGGQVRCGHCQQVFDGFATLTAQEPQPPAAAPAPAETPRQAAQAPAQAAGPSVGKAGESQLATSPKAKANLRPDPAASLYEWEFRVPETPRRTGMWAGVTALLLIALGGQAAFAFRNELMVLAPQSRPLYDSACRWLGCIVGLPKLSRFLHIEASDLKAPDPVHPNEIELQVSVRNRAPVDLAYPAFELTLTNAQEQTVSRRVFLAAEYLTEKPADNGLPAGAELPITLFLDTGAIRAAGYRLYLFYP